MLLWRNLVGYLGSRPATFGAVQSALSSYSAVSHCNTRMPPTTRARSSRSSNDLPTESNIDGRPKKKARSAPKKSKPKPTKASARTTAAKDDEKGEESNGPWFNIFTKGDKEYNHYMATEWSYETRGDQALFERLSLEGAQAGLSWLTILRKREAYRQTFYNFDPNKVATMTNDDVERILATEPASKKDTSSVIVRHRGKIEAVIHNAKLLLELQGEKQDKETALDSFLWSFVDDKPILNYFGNKKNGSKGQASVSLQDFPTQTAESQAISKALKKRGWKFVGPTTCYAMMQAVGMVIDHPHSTPEWKLAEQRLKQRPGGYQERN